MRTTPQLVVATLAVGVAVSVAGAVHAQSPDRLTIAAGSGLETPGDKDGGVAWGDFNDDGCLDAAVNTDDSALGTRLYEQATAGGDCALTFADVTASVAPALGASVRERSVVWGDVDNDGDLDLVRNSFDRIELYVNAGSPEYSLDLAQTIDRESIAVGGLNAEGLGLVDYDADGVLDLIADSHEFGIAAFQNLGGSAPFVLDVDSGLPFGGSGTDGSPQGDYIAVADYDGDGDVDVLDRRRRRSAEPEFGVDFFTNVGGSFTAGQDILDAPDRGSGNKGGVVLCDFDNDLDLDAFWTDGDDTQAGVNSVWLQAGPGTGVFEASGLPSGVAGDIDGVACGDIDNDGDIDLALTSDGEDLLLVNQLLETGSLGFVSEVIAGTAADGEGNTFADVDRDGDLDLLVNQEGANVLLLNQHDGDDSLMVDPREGPRSAIGATAWLESCGGVPVSGLNQVDGGSGHGSQSGGLVMHFGLGGIGGSNVPYVVATRFVGGDVVRVGVVPADLDPGQAHRVAHDDVSDTSVCAPELTVAAATPAGLTAGAEAVIELEVTNIGAGDAAGTSVDITLVGAVAVDPLPPSCVQAVQITCALDDVPSGTGVVVPITVVVDESATDVTVQITLLAEGSDPTEITLTLETVAEADLIVSSSIPDSGVAGDRLTISVTVTNDGPSTAQGLLITQEVPASVAHVEAASEPGSCSIDDTTAACSIDSLAAGASGTATVSVEVGSSATGSVTILVAVTSATPDPDPDGNAFELSIPIGGADGGGGGDGGSDGGGGGGDTGPGGTSGGSGGGDTGGDDTGGGGGAGTGTTGGGGSGGTTTPTTGVTTAGPTRGGTVSTTSTPPETTAPGSSTTTAPPGRSDGDADPEGDAESTTRDGTDPLDTDPTDGDGQTALAAELDGGEDSEAETILLTLLTLTVAAVLAISNWRQATERATRGDDGSRPSA